MTNDSPETRTAPLVDASGLAAALAEFANERDWAQFHSPKNLVMALTGEVGELSEIFQWMTEAESVAAMQDPRTAERVRHEIADVMMYLVRLADMLRVDLDEALREKLALNAQKYPAALAKGSREKSRRG